MNLIFTRKLPPWPAVIVSEDVIVGFCRGGIAHQESYTAVTPPVNYNNDGAIEATRPISA